MEMTQKELQNKLEDLLEEMQNLRFQHATHQLDNPLRLRMVRKDIARIKTVLKEYEKGIREPRG
ncbi:50S ribosomal protein L29 [candidate division KSB1 bacterium 4484_87]|nr:MAG: 50S ribosomal protein L29 [candidate division KSB1 bacterium 4484_87]